MHISIIAFIRCYHIWCAWLYMWCMSTDWRRQWRIMWCMASKHDPARMSKSGNAQTSFALIAWLSTCETYHWQWTCIVLHKIYFSNISLSRYLACLILHWQGILLELHSHIPCSAAIHPGILRLGCVNLSSLLLLAFLGSKQCNAFVLYHAQSPLDLNPIC